MNRTEVGVGVLTYSDIQGNAALIYRPILMDFHKQSINMGPISYKNIPEHACNSVSLKVNYLMSIPKNCEKWLCIQDKSHPKYLFR